MPHLEEGRVVERFRLAADRFDDLRAAVSGVHAPQARRAVEYPLATLALVMHVPGRYQDAGRGLELAVGGKRHPERLEGVVAWWHGSRAMADGRSILPVPPGFSHTAIR